MVFEQTVEIPDSHWLAIEVPRNVPAGKARLALTVTPEAAAQDKAQTPLLAMFGIDRGKDTLDAYLARKRADKAREDAQIERQLHVNLCQRTYP